MFQVWVTGVIPLIYKSCDLSLAIGLDFQLQDEDDGNAYVRGTSSITKKESLACGPLPSSYLQPIWGDETQTQEPMNRKDGRRRLITGKLCSDPRPRKEGSDDGGAWQLFWKLHQKVTLMFPAGTLAKGPCDWDSAGRREFWWPWEGKGSSHRIGTCISRQRSLDLI